MSASTARLKRGTPPAKKFRRHTYRKALPFLLEEFDGRCVYSDQHYLEAGGLRSMEIDHVDPRRKKRVVQEYSNLVLATRHCNGAKSDFWPNARQLANGLRVINPCLEADWGVHVFEDPDSHRLWGATPTGIWHIRTLDLNAQHFVTERKLRAELRPLVAAKPVTITGTWASGFPEIPELLKLVNRLIGDIPLAPPPLGYRWV